MRYKIVCSADRLGLLDPHMIESIATPNAYHRGRQYVAENRVRIVEADDRQIAAAIIGYSGLYEQTIRLKDGHLLSKCSCTLSEEPMCRHCIAALLEYHRWTQRRQPQKAKTSPSSSEDADPIPPSPPASSTVPNVTLSEVLQFVAWLEPAFKAMESGADLPSPPQLPPGVVSSWIATITNLEVHQRENQQALQNLQTEMRDRDAYLDRLSQQLQASIAETKAAHLAIQTLQRDVARYQELLGHASSLIRDLIGQEAQIRSAAHDLLEKASHLDSLTMSFHELTDLLHLSLNQANANK
ncbi:MAG: hypothetical protein NNA18_11965 [Nitrospira sp.]|nr:hypothetical protein [Nitrospira sp.]